MWLKEDLQQQRQLMPIFVIMIGYCSEDIPISLLKYSAKTKKMSAESVKPKAVLN